MLQITKLPRPRFAQVSFERTVQFVWVEGFTQVFVANAGKCGDVCSVVHQGEYFFLNPTTLRSARWISVYASAGTTSKVKSSPILWTCIGNAVCG
jgi:hypothetical protein